MKTTTASTTALAVLTALIAGWAQPGLAQEVDVPSGFVHQGYIEVDGQPFSGTGDFYFAIVESFFGNNVWTNDGSQLTTSNRPDTPVSLEVNEGIYSVSIGDGGDTDILDLSALDVAVPKLRVWFDDGTNGVQQLTPDQELHSVPFARAADTANDVRGEITVDKVNYTNPRTHVHTIPPTAFHPTDNEESFSVTAERVTTGGGASLYAPAALPDGATITRMRVAGSNANPDDPFNIDLVAVEAAPSPTTSSVASTFLNPLSGDVIVTEDGINEQVGPDTAYSIVTSQPGLTLEGNMELFWVQVEYTLPEAR